MKSKSCNFNYISKLNDDDCKYLYNIYTRFNDKSGDKNIQEYLERNKCLYNSRLEDVVRICEEEHKTLLVITNKKDDRYVQLKEKCKKQNIPIVLIDNKDKIAPNYIRKLIGNTNSGIFLDFNISSFNEWYNWDVIIEERIAKTLEKFSNIEYKEVQSNPKKYVLDCILHYDTKKNIHKQNEKFNIVSIIKRIDKLIEKGFNLSGNVLANIHSSNNIHNYYLYEMAELINTLTYTNLVERYEYIYDLICGKLENDIDRFGYCLFKDNKCIAQRELQEWPKNEYNGCCFDINKKKSCDHLKCKQCNIKCISCRLFTCKYLKDRGIDYDIHKNVHALCFFNILQRPELVWNFFTNKEEILKNISKYSVKINRKLRKKRK